MANTEPVRIMSLPGIKRDGTRFEGDQYVDGQWVRFQRGLPRKIGGYRSTNKYLQAIPRTLHEYMQNDLTYIHAGSANRLERFFLDADYDSSVISNRTPVTLTADSRNLWQFDVETSARVSGLQLVAQVAPNLDCVCNSTGGQLFYGSLFGTSALTAATLPAGASVTGGVVSLHPYTVAFGNDGYVMWSDDCTNFTVAGAGNAYVTGQKIVRGLPVRGGPGNSPSGLLWSADSLIRMSYVGGTPTFSFDTLSSESSIMSAQSVIEYDGVFYWIGRDRFLLFNGVVREVPNDLNSNFLFDNIRDANRQKVFAFKVPRFGEIWWCFPFGDSDEPNHAIIYNVRENTWYDTALPEGGRSAALPPTVYPKPLMAGVEPRDYILSAASIYAAGTGYTAGDLLTTALGSGPIPLEVTVTTVGGGGTVTGVSISNAGQYTTTPSARVSMSGGTGTGVQLDLTYVTPYKFWVHEVGVDKVDGSDIQPIQSYFETADLSRAVTAKDNKAIFVDFMEPDFVQAGDMTVQVHGRANARAGEVGGEIKTIVETPSVPEEQIVLFKEQRRELRFRFESNVIGGDYQMGLILAHLGPGDETVLGALAS